MILRNKQYANRTLFRMFIIAFCYLMSFCSAFLNIDIVILICVVLFFILTYKADLGFLLKYIGLLAPIGIGLLGVYIIENDNLWLVELQKNSHHAGSYPLFAGYYLLFSLSLELFDKRYVRKGKSEATIKINANRMDIINIILDVFGYSFYIVTLFMTLRLITHPYFIVHMDRFAYREQYIKGVWAKIANYYIYFIPLLLMNWHRNKHKKLTVITLAFYMLYLFIQGEKYGGYITVVLYISLYFIPQIARRHKKTIKKVFRFVVVTICVAFGLILLQYKILYPTMKPFESVYQRFAQQGQLWWSIYDLQKEESPHLEEITDELDAYTNNSTNSTPYYAIYKIMYLSAPRNVVTNKIATGSTYTESTAASLYYYFGPLVLPFFAICMGWFFSFLAFKYANYIKGKCIIEVVVVSRLIAMGRGFFSMSFFTWLFDFETLMTLFILGTLVCIRKIKGQRFVQTDLIQGRNILC